MASTLLRSALLVPATAGANVLQEKAMTRGLGPLAGVSLDALRRLAAKPFTQQRGA